MIVLLLLSLFNTYVLAWCTPVTVRRERESNVGEIANFTAEFGGQLPLPDPVSHQRPFLSELESPMNINNTDTLAKLNITLDSLQEIISGASVNTTTKDEEKSLQELHKNHRESLEKRKTERNKEQRLKSIKSHVLTLLGLHGRTPVLNASQLPNNNQMKQIYDRWRLNGVPQPGDVYTERVQSFYPSCDAPRNTDHELWNHPNSFRLYFDLRYPKAQEGSSVGIIAAKLKLFKLSQGEVQVPPADMEPCTPAEETLSQQSYLANGLREDSKVRVSVYWYTRSLKKHRDKKKLLDSLMLSVYGDEWVEFDIRSAVRSWHKSGRNFGLVLEVEDEDKNIHPPNNFFKEMNCSDGATFAHPFPSFLVDAARRYDRENGSVNFYQNMFPMVDLVTVELPEDETEGLDKIPVSYKSQRKPSYLPHANNPLFSQSLFGSYNVEEPSVRKEEHSGYGNEAQPSFSVNSEGVTTIPILHNAHIFNKQPLPHFLKRQIQHVVRSRHQHRHNKHHTETKTLDNLGV